MARNTKGRDSARRSRGRKVAFRIALVLLSLLVVEGGLRAALVPKVGWSVIAYGTPAARRALQPTKLTEQPWHEQIASIEASQRRVGGEEAGYLKYHPRQKKDGYDEHGAQYWVGINAQGFRGRDFETAKPAGVVRIATLGGSSTFGYHDRDDETYPAYLEAQLNARLAKEPIAGVARFEVMNFGIPHLDSAQVAALFEAEVLAYAPDVVTIYKGVNDTRHLKPSGGEQVLHAAAQRLVAAQFVYQVALPWFASFDGDDYAAAKAGRAERFLANLGRIRDRCAERGIRFVAITQQAQSDRLPRAELAKVSYAEEAEQTRAHLASGAKLTLRELQFLLQSDLMAALREWSAASRVELVDGNAALEQAGQRDALLSWVHLAPRGNAALAEAIAARVWEGWAAE